MNLLEVLNEEVDMFINGLNKQELINIIPLLQEDSKLLNALSKVEKDSFNLDNQVTQENWAFFTDCLKQVVTLESFQQKALLVNCKLFCVKKFTELDFKLPNNIEDILKFEIKKYFNRLVTSDGEEFVKELFDLPFEFVSMVIRYVSKVYDQKICDAIAPSEQLAERFYTYVIKIQEKFIKLINQISKGETNNFAFADARLLLDVKAFYSYNALNVGCLEYIVRLTNDTKAQEKLYAQYGKDAIDYMREQAIFHPSYIQFLKKIKSEEEAPFFDSDGTQNEKREKTFNDIVVDVYEPENKIPKVPDSTNQQVTAEPTELDLSQQQGQEPAQGQNPPQQAPQNQPQGAQQPEKQQPQNNPFPV